MRPPRASLALALAAAALAPVAVAQQAPATPPGHASPAAAPMPASLVADQVTYDRDRKLLVATGNVEVLYQGRVLRATEITYDEGKQEIRAVGPLLLTDPAGGVIMADSASLTPDLKAGLISSAKLLISGKLQLAAAEVRRKDAQFTTLYRTVASSCTICADDPTPTWAIRASRVTQDTVARRIYFEHARLELFGFPVGYAPRLSIPEPGVTRASGVLVPQFLQSGIYGFGFKLPYYRVISPSADYTITPFLTTSGAKLVEGQYRRRFDDGGFDVGGVVAFDDGLGNNKQALRGSLAASGNFALGQGFIASFDLAAASDNSFLAQFDYSDADRLTSIAGIHRTLGNEYFSVSTIAFQSLNDDEATDTIPFVFPALYYRRLFDAPVVGGRVGIDANSLGIARDVGGDMIRAGGGVDWQNGWTLANGVLASSTASAVVDLYRTWDYDDIPDGTDARAMPLVSGELRWPLVKSTAAAQHVIEPIAQVIWSQTVGDDDVPNEDSQLPEFDDLNLFSLNRFPGEDRLETGLRANLGINYTRQDPSGWSLGATLGRVFRVNDKDQFSEGTGLDGTWSDYVGALSLDFASGLTLVNRALFSDTLDFQRNEFAMAYDSERAGIRAAYIYLAQDDSDPVIGDQPETSEFAFNARYRLRPNWEVRGLWRYDVAAHSNLRAGAGITYGNECTEFDLSIQRRYTSSENLPPTTSIGFSLKLAGVGDSGDNKWPARVCTARGA
ncbi:MAG: LPS assembly protein LptD [Amaricoccus sp.]